MSAIRRRHRKDVTINDLRTHAEPFVVLRALREYFKVDDRTIRKWIREGALTAYRFDGLWRVKTADALAFEEKNRLAQ